MNRKYLLLCLLIPFIGFSAQSAEKPRITVTRFGQEVRYAIPGCRVWDYNDQFQMRTVLEGELSKRGLRVLERRAIREIYSDEFTQENLDHASVPQAKKFLAAQYTVTGAIVEQGICEKRSGSGLKLGGVISLLGGPGNSDLDISRKKAVSRVKLVAQLISVQTGEVLKSFSAKAEIEDSGMEFSAEVLGIGGRHKAQSIPPIERATNDCLIDLSKQIADYLR